MELWLLRSRGFVNKYWLGDAIFRRFLFVEVFRRFFKGFVFWCDPSVRSHWRGTVFIRNEIFNELIDAYSGSCNWNWNTILFHDIYSKYPANHFTVILSSEKCRFTLFKNAIAVKCMCIVIFAEIIWPRKCSSLSLIFFSNCNRERIVDSLQYNSV